jgi:hypothetical protein
LKGELFLGDLARALRGLDVRDTATAMSVARLLGLRLIDEVHEVRPLPLSSPSISSAEPKAETTFSPPTPTSPPSQPTQLPPIAELGTVRVTPLPPAQPKGWEPVEAVPVQTRASVPEPPDPLLPVRELRALLTTALSLGIPDGELDVDRAVAAFAQGRPLAHLPRRAVATLRRGVDVLVDRGSGMQPFSADVEALSGHLGQLLGTEAARAGRFDGTPDLVDHGHGAEPWVPRFLGGAVLVVSDLGAPPDAASRGRWMSVDNSCVWRDWVDWFSACKGRASRVVVLAPWPGRPAWLPPTVRVLTWDTTTTIADARRAR